MLYAVTWSLLLIFLAGAAAAHQCIAEQDGLGFDLEELLNERGTIRLEFETTISALSSDEFSGLYQTIWVELARKVMLQTHGTMEGAAGL
jgi:hypothetical protein